MKVLLIAVIAGCLLIPATASATGNHHDHPGLCHKTGNGSFVFVPANNNAFPAHLAHHGDVISTNGKCPYPPKPCPPPEEVEVPVVIEIPGPERLVPVPGPVQVVEVPGATQTKTVVLTPKRKPMKCERRFNSRGRLVIVCKRKNPRPDRGGVQGVTTQGTGDPSHLTG
jgi:hypothetical protein